MKTAVFVCLAVSLLSAQDTIDLRGRVLSDDHPSLSGLAVQLTSFANRTFRDRADVMSDGSFQFRGVPPGDYQVTVTTLYGEEITSTYASASQVSGPVEIRLPERKLSRPASGTVSIQQLSHPLSRQVRKLLENGQRFLKEQHYDRAVTLFRQAVEDDPNCPQAHGDLAIALAREGLSDGAIQEYRTAISIDPHNSMLHGYFSATLANAGHFDDARKEANAALQFDPLNARAHFVLGAILLRDGGHIPEAIPHLAAARDSFASAGEALNKLCAAKTWKGCPAQ